MSTFLISILSDHILPNYLFAKEIEGRYDRHIFIVTEYTALKKRTDNLYESALGLMRSSAARIIVDNDNYAAICQKLSTFPFNDEDEYIINLTGGTKAMSVAVHSFFRRFRSEFYYIPIGENKYFNFDSAESMDIRYRVSLREYLSLYGLTFDPDNAFMFNPNIAENLFRRQLRAAYPIKEIRNAQNAATPELKRYYGGVWFEEYVYWRIKKDMCLPANAISKSVKIYRSNADNPSTPEPDKPHTNDNEIDVLFVKDNVLYFIECKVSMAGYGSSQDTVSRYLYKIAAVSKDLGLKVNSYLFTLHRMDTFSEETLANIRKRTAILGIRDIVSRDYFWNHPTFII